jgi:hypothetical protein
VTGIPPDQIESRIKSIRSDMPFGLPNTDEGLVYLMIAFLLKQYKVSSSRICFPLDPNGNKQIIIPSMDEILSKYTPPRTVQSTIQDITKIYFTITNNITPNNNILFDPNETNNSNDNLSHEVIAHWILCDLQESNNFAKLFTTILSHNGILPNSLCKLKEKKEKFSGTISTNENLVGNSSPVAVASNPIPAMAPIRAPPKVSPMYSPMSSSKSSMSSSTDSTTVIIIVVVVIVVLSLIGGVLYYNRKSIFGIGNQNTPLPKITFNKGE